MASIELPPQSTVNPFEVLARHYEPHTRLYQLLVTHSILVGKKALEIAQSYGKNHPGVAIDQGFLVEAALLHDIGVQHCKSPKILCFGDEPYIRHGVIGREILEAEGLPRHALVCERHTGAGITAGEVEARSLPLPVRDYLPVTLEEKIICVADKFYSKSPAKLWKERSLEKTSKKLAKWGPEISARWRALCSEILK